MIRPTTRLVFAHGWGFDAELWTPLRDALGLQDTFAVDLGFRQPARARIPFKGHPFVAIGHSLGVLWLLMQDGLALTGLISINGFLRFTQGPGFEAGVHPKFLARMRAGLDKDPAAVYREFMERIGVTKASADGLNVERLSEGLEWLATWDARQRLAALDVPVLALAGRQDPIAPPAMTEQAFAGYRIDWAEDGGHRLPETHRDWCCERIRAFLGETG